MLNTLEKIIVIDDEPGMCRLLQTILGEEGYKVSTFHKPTEALKTFKQEHFDLVITDICMPKISGIDILKEVKTILPAIPVILITAYSTVESAVEAMKMGASDYVVKPFKNDEIIMKVQKILEKQRLIEENKRLRLELASKYSFGEIIGKTPKMEELFHIISQVSQTNSTVFIQGESGTGKELVARAIHYNSSRGQKPFMAINCGALPETLLESELFGHTKGAFTDATKDRIGLLESAEGGTIFLDEIGEMPFNMQVRLLRFLQDHEIRPLGSSHSKHVDVRVIAATNKDIRKMINQEKFREDLYYRLAVVPLYLPPLRERVEDIPLLAEHLLEKAAKKLDKGGFFIAPETLKTFMDHHWPGNIRELENVIEYAINFTPSSNIQKEALPRYMIETSLSLELASLQKLSYREAKQKLLDSFEKNYLSELLNQSKGNISQAAQTADMDRNNFKDLLKKHNLLPQEKTAQAVE